MDVQIINPFLEAAIHVLKTMARVEPKPGKPFLKKNEVAMGCITGIIGIAGAAKGSLSISFHEECIKTIVSNLLGTYVPDVNDEVQDAVGELTNMICGDGRRRLEEKGIGLEAGTPTVVSGEHHRITHICTGPYLAVPFETPSGPFVMEVAFNN